MTHTSKNKLNLEPMLTNINIGGKLMLVSSSFHLNLKLCVLSRTLPTTERNQTPNSEAEMEIYGLKYLKSPNCFSSRQAFS